MAGVFRSTASGQPGRQSREERSWGQRPREQFGAAGKQSLSSHLSYEADACCPPHPHCWQAGPGSLGSLLLKSF